MNNNLGNIMVFYNRQMQKKRKININKIRSALYKISKISEGVNVVQKGARIVK